MTNEEKLDIILEYKNIRNSTISQKLNISPALVSQWRNRRSSKLNTLHLNALENAFNIPLDIFKNRDIDTKEKVLNKLEESSDTLFDNCILKKLFPIELMNSWYCYSFNNNGNLNVYLVEISRYEVKVYNSQKELTYSGYPIAINDYQTQLVVTKENEPYSIIVTINNNSINSNIFYASSSFKSSSNKDALMFCIFSKEKIEKSVVIEILGDKSKNLLTLKSDIIQNIKTYKEDKERLLNKAVSLKYAIGKWYLYFDKVETDNIITIDENLNVVWFKNGNFYKDGELIRDKNAVILMFPSSIYHSSYFMFKIDNIDTKIIHYIGSKYITGQNIISVGVMCKKRLQDSDIKTILSGIESSLNISKIYENLDNYLNN